MAAKRGEEGNQAPPRPETASNAPVGGANSVGRTDFDKIETGPASAASFVPKHADGAEYDDELGLLLRVAAWAGLRGGDAEGAINYTTLLIGFALCTDEASLWLHRQRPLFRRTELLESRKLNVSDGPQLVRRAAEERLPAGRHLYTPSAAQMLDHAGEIALAVTGERNASGADHPVGTRHLLAAYLLRTPENHFKDLRQWGLDPDRLRPAFLEFVRDTWEDEGGNWAAVYFDSGIPPAADRTAQASKGNAPLGGTTALERALYVASFGADDPSIQGRDLLDVKDEARAFARVAASCSTRLPLSIGVFGEWGSGKTFFMGLMSEHVERLSKRAKGDEKPLFLPDIVQIKFNAWHYIETNLWASLVEYIFSELDRSLQGSQKPSEQVERLFEQLSTSRLLKLEAIENLIVKRRERKTAEERLDRARRDYEAGLLRQSATTSREFWKAVFETFRDKLTKESGAQVEKLAKELGLKDFSTSAGSLNEVLKESETEAGRARVLHRAMVAKMGQGWWILAVVAVLVAAPAGLVLLKDALALAPGAEWIAKVNSAVLALSGMLAAATGLIGRAVGSVRNSLTELEGFRNKIDAAVKEHTEKFKNQSDEAATFAEAERDIARLKNELEQAERKFSDADKRSDEVLRDYQSGTARGRLNAFIRDKLASGDYARHLGLIATIRKDFEQLAQLMADAGNDGKSRADYLRAHEEYRKHLQELLQRARDEGTISQDEQIELGKDTTAPEPGLFTRIILYIDDLDRCPPDKVVDVLQAIHLLLYFPLFVVVVAVDARWVSRSLREQFPQLLEENIIAPRRKRASGLRTAARDGANVRSDEENERADDNAAPAKQRDAELLTAATSHDYLEKIFQIPYWVRPMDRDASMKYVKGIADADVRVGTAEVSGQRAGTGVPPPASVISSSSPRDGAIAQAAGTALPDAPGAAPVQQQPPEQAQAQHAASDPQAQEETEQQAEYVARSMTLTIAERDFLEALAPFVGSTPRRGLRFVNIYRLVKTGLPEKLQNEMVDESGNQLGHRALITQLAIVTGAPHISSIYFQLLENATGAIVQRRAAPPALNSKGENKIETLAELCGQLKGELAAIDGSQRLALLGALERLRTLNEKQGLDAGPELLLALERYAPIARRYSFTARPH